MNPENSKQYDIFSDDAHFAAGDPRGDDIEFDNRCLEIFDKQKLDPAIKLFLKHYPDAKDYEVIDFVTRSRRSYLRAKRQNLDDASWLETLKNYVKSFKFTQPLENEIRKITFNQQLVEMKIELAKLAKEKAKLEKEKIDFLLEQNNLSKTGKSAIYPNLTTITKLEAVKKDIENRYRKVLKDLQARQKDSMKNAIDSEVERVRDEFDQRYNQWSRFYEMFKQKYFNLQNFSLQMRDELNDKNNESYDLKLKINQLMNELKSQESQIKMLTSELEKRTQTLEDFKNSQPIIIKKNVERELEDRMQAQTNKLNSILLEKEKILVGEIENRRNEIESVLESKRKEFDRMVSTTKEIEAQLKVSNEELQKAKSDYSRVAKDNEALTNEIQGFRSKYEKLGQLLAKLQADNADLEKLNRLLVKKYNDSRYFEIANQQLTDEISQITKTQESLLNLISENRAQGGKVADSFKTLTADIRNLDSKFDAIKAMNLNPSEGEEAAPPRGRRAKPAADAYGGLKDFAKKEFTEEEDELINESLKIEDDFDDDDDDGGGRDMLADKLINIE